MSAEILNEAASRIRQDAPFGTADQNTFMLAVAEMLEGVATDFFAGVRAEANIARISTYPAVAPALAVARAYLGGDA